MADIKKDKKIRKIWIINPTAGSIYHGPNMRSYYIARNLLLRNYQVAIITSAYFHKFFSLPKVEQLFTTESLDGIKYCWIKNKRYRHRGLVHVISQLNFALILFFKFKKLKLFKPDIILVSSPHPFGIFAGLRIAKYFNIKLIFEIRDLWPLLLQQINRLPWFHPYILILSLTERYAYKKADHIVSVKPGDYGYLRSRFALPEDMFSYIPNGFDINNIYHESLPEYLLDRIPKNKFIIGYVGAISSGYGLKYFIYAAKKLSKIDSSISFVMVGAGPEKEPLQNYVKKNKLTNIIFLGFIKKKYILNIINLFDVCYLSQRKVGVNKFGISSNKTYEYMYLKKPILASIDTPFDPVKQSGCGISVNPEDSKSIIDAIIKFRKMSKEDLLALGKKGYKYLVTHHSYQKIADLYELLLARLSKEDLRNE